MLLAVVIATIGGGSFYLYFWLKNSLPVRDGTVVIGGIDKEIEITLDSMGIPQIWAETEDDGYFALGYLHASDRTFQMDLARRMAQGRMSELLGEVTLETDKRQRQIGHHRIARKAQAQLDEKNRLRLQAYANGVNAYRQTSGAPPFEYLLLGANFEEWTVHDCLALLTFQAWYSDALQNHDQFYLQLKEKVGEAKAGTLSYLYPEWAPVTMAASKKSGTTDSVSKGRLSAPFLPDQIEPYLMSNSSNAFAVGPHKSAGGQALLASDPHLQINQLPQFWYLVGLHIRENDVNVLGISTPGLPFVVMGHNGQAAWAFTAGGLDITDFYAETVHPQDTSRYAIPSGWSPFDYVTDTILVSGLDTSVVLTTKLTRHGPVLTGSDSAAIKSFRWVGFDADLNLAASSGFALHEVSRFDDFQKIVTNLGALNAHWIYADINGNIGYQLGTPLPVRPAQGSQVSAPGRHDDLEWQGYYPLSKTPHSLNPAQGWLASSNNLPTRSSEFAALSGNFAADRIIRISQLLNEKEEITAEDCRSFQLDRIDAYLLRWRWEMAKLLLELGQPELSDLINSWNGSTALDSRETALTMAFLTQLKLLTFADELGDLSKGVRTLWLDAVFHNEACNFWFDDMATDTVESRNEIARRAMAQAIDIVGQKTWGDFNSLTMRHPMSGVPIIGGLLELNRGVWPWPGTAGTLNASFLVANDDNTFQTIVGPNWRFVIDFADVDGAVFVLPAGNSGNPMSPHFFDFNQMWQAGRYWNVPISQKRVKDKAASVLVLKPDLKGGQN